MLEYKLHANCSRGPKVRGRPADPTPRLLDRDDPEKVVKAEAKRLRKKAKRLEVIKRAEFRRRKRVEIATLRGFIATTLAAAAAARDFGEKMQLLAAAASAPGRARAIFGRRYVVKATPNEEAGDAS